MSAPPCSPSPAPPKSAPGGCLSESIQVTDCSPARPGGLLSAPPCSPSPAPPKSAPGGCLSESITDYSITLSVNHFSAAIPLGLYVCGILICVKCREDGVAASVQLRPPVRAGPAHPTYTAPPPAASANPPWLSSCSRYCRLIGKFVNTNTARAELWYNARLPTLETKATHQSCASKRFQVSSPVLTQFFYIMILEK